MKASEYPQIARIWNFEKNKHEGIIFDEVTPGSGKKVWWKCHKGHEWQAIVCNVVGKSSSCPYCSGRKAIPGQTDLATLKPELAAEWDYEKNDSLSPKDVTAGSGKKVWWKCHKGHEWQAVISSRSSGVGCPVCANKIIVEGFNDLASTHPVLLEEWNYEKNSNIKPTEVSFGSEKKVWWRCKNNHEWKAAIGDRVHGRGCPYCSNRKVLSGNNTIDVTNPEIAKLWNFKKNGGMKPSDITIGSGKNVWWQCDKGHEWQAAPYNIAKGQSCPYCSNRQVLVGFNDLETLNPDIAKEWNYEKNGDLKPSDVVAGSTKSVWWKCHKGHEWQARIYSRNQNHSCPFCSLYKITSVPEKAIAFYLIKYGIDIEENKKIDGMKSVDIYLPKEKIAIEYDGQYYHSDIDRDLDKNKICKSLGIKLLRIREPKLPRLNSTSIDYTIEKLDNNYAYLEGAIKWVFRQISIKHVRIDISEEIQNILNYYNKREVDNSIVNTCPDIAKEWDYGKNKVKIETISKGSDLKVWWKCGKCSYEWQQSVIARCSGSGKCPRCASLRLITGHNDLATTNTELLSEWNYKKNTIKPSEITAGSNERVWWVCPKGHEYQAAPHNRTRGKTGCPVCAGKIVEKGFNDLASFEPRIAGEWDYDKNHGMSPDEITQNSSKKIWWRCKNGHSWEATVNSRTRGNGCPYCSGRYASTDNNLLANNPELAAEWNYEKNKGLSPESFTSSSGRIVWWKCNNGHEWQASIDRRNHGNGCPYCSGRLPSFTNNLAAKRPELLAEWDYEKNKNIKPDSITCGSGKKVWWKCRECGHSWEASVAKRCNGRGCPVCAGRVVKLGYNDFLTTNPEMAKEWDYEKNGDLKPTMITNGSHKEVWWKCYNCGFEWKSRIATRKNYPGCRKCHIKNN